MDNILPQFSKSLEDFERNIKDYNASLLELHQHLIKTTSEICEARLKLAEAMNPIMSFLKDTDYMRENPIIDEAEIAHNDAEAELLAELSAEHAEENNLSVRQ